MYHVTLDFRRSCQFPPVLPLPLPLCHAPCSRRPTLWHFSLVFALLFFFATFLIWTPAQHATKSSSSTVVDVVAKICGCHLIKSARQLSPDSVPAAPLTTSPHPQADLPTITSLPPPHHPIASLTQSHPHPHPAVALFVFVNCSCKLAGKCRCLLLGWLIKISACSFACQPTDSGHKEGAR